MDTLNTESVPASPKKSVVIKVFGIGKAGLEVIQTMLGQGVLGSRSVGGSHRLVIHVLAVLRSKKDLRKDVGQCDQCDQYKGCGPSHLDMIVKRKSCEIVD